MGYPPSGKGRPPPPPIPEGRLVQNHVRPPTPPIPGHVDVVHRTSSGKGKGTVCGGTLACSEPACEVMSAACMTLPPLEGMEVSEAQPLRLKGIVSRQGQKSARKLDRFSRLDPLPPLRHLNPDMWATLLPVKPATLQAQCARPGFTRVPHTNRSRAIAPTVGLHGSSGVASLKPDRAFMKNCRKRRRAKGVKKRPKGCLARVAASLSSEADPVSVLGKRSKYA